MTTAKIDKPPRCRAEVGLEDRLYKLTVSFAATRRRDRPARVSSSVADSVTFRFHPIFFPATQFLSGEKLNVVTAVIRSAVNECRLVGFLPRPSLICLDWQSTVRA